MQIFIDESGIFKRSASGSSLSAVGALIIPDERLSYIEQKYAKIRSSLPKENGEVKGRRLSEPQIDRVVSMLAKNESIFEVNVVDLSLNTDADIVAHQHAQADKITGNVTEKHSSIAVEFAYGLRTRLESMSPQLYVQSVVTFDLIARVLQHATLYFAQRRPRELAAFHWIVDGKERARVTDWEDWWSVMVIPWLQTKSIKEPMGKLEGADYSYFQRFDSRVPDYLKFLVDDPVVTDIGMVMTESFRFSSNADYSLELIDILTNATKRALSRNLTIEGWRHIPRLMIHTREHYIRLLTMSRADVVHTPAYAPIVRYFRSGGRSMLAPRFQ